MAVSNPDDETMKHQQQADLGRLPRDDAPPRIDGAVKGPIERLDRGVDSDGFLEKPDPDGLPDPDDEEARRRAVAEANRAGSPRRHAG